jgi:uncharacterized protein YdeI (YjbR/CyaY-like superfamily)
MTPTPKSFRTQADYRAWLQRHHATEKEQFLRLYKTHAKDRGIGYREALDEALCFGWIDGVRRSLDDVSFTQRFTPRKAKSNWSAVNIKRVKELEAEGRMCEPGLAAFRARTTTGPAPYSFENRNITFDAAAEKTFRANKRAWKFFEEQAPWYRRTTAFWVMSAKKEETRAKRLAELIARCADGARVGILERAK